MNKIISTLQLGFL